MRIERGDQFLLHSDHLLAREMSGMRPHATRNVEADAARRNDAARLGVEGGYSADPKTVASLGVRHGVGRSHDARKRRDIRDLIEDLLVHFGDPALARVDDRRNAHCAERRNFPAYVRNFLQTANGHCGSLCAELVWR